MAAKKVRRVKKATRSQESIDFDDTLKNWYNLNAIIASCDEDTCNALFEEEANGRKRKTFLTRIKKRINRLRAYREKLEMENWQP